MASAAQVPEEYRQEIVPLLLTIAVSEQWAADVTGYWMHDVPLDSPEMKDLKHDMAKMTYDEARHNEICLQMAGHFGGAEAVDKAYEKWANQENQRTLDQLNRCVIEGMNSFVDWMAIVPVIGDRAGLEVFADLAECSPDPIWTDAAESVHEDEHHHISIASEYMPYIIERYGEPMREEIEQTLEKWVPFMMGFQGKPGSEHRQRQIESGVFTMTLEETHELQYDALHDMYDPLGIEVPHLDADEYLARSELVDYVEENIIHGE